MKLKKPIPVEALQGEVEAMDHNSGWYDVEVYLNQEQYEEIPEVVDFIKKNPANSHVVRMAFYLNNNECVIGVYGYLVYCDNVFWSGDDVQIFDASGRIAAYIRETYSDYLEHSQKMKTQKMLYVAWSEDEKANYYVDKDEYSRAHEVDGTKVTLKTFEGTYTFDKSTKSKNPTLDTGTEIKEAPVLSWSFYETPIITQPTTLNQVLEVTGSGEYIRIASERGNGWLVYDRTYLIPGNEVFQKLDLGNRKVVQMYTVGERLAERTCCHLQPGLGIIVEGDENGAY